MRKTFSDKNYGIFCKFILYNSRKMLNALQSFAKHLDAYHKYLKKYSYLLEGKHVFTFLIQRAFTL